MCLVLFSGHCISETTATTDYIECKRCWDVSTSVSMNASVCIDKYRAACYRGRHSSCACAAPLCGTPTRFITIKKVVNRQTIPGKTASSVDPSSILWQNRTTQQSRKHNFVQSVQERSILHVHAAKSTSGSTHYLQRDF